MRCHDARRLLGNQRDGTDQGEDGGQLAAHLETCESCRAFHQHLHKLESLLDVRPSTRRGSTTTGNIMQAIQERKKISQQLDHIQESRKARWERMRLPGAICALLTIVGLASLPLVGLLLIFQRGDMAIAFFTAIQGLVDLSILLGDYVRIGLLLLSQDTLLLAAAALAVVVMMGMWLRLMRYPQEV